MEHSAGLACARGHPVGRLDAWVPAAEAPAQLPLVEDRPCPAASDAWDDARPVAAVCVLRADLQQAAAAGKLAVLEPDVPAQADWLWVDLAAAWAAEAPCKPVAVPSAEQSCAVRWPADEQEAVQLADAVQLVARWSAMLSAALPVGAV